MQTQPVLYEVGIEFLNTFYVKIRFIILSHLAYILILTVGR